MGGFVVKHSRTENTLRNTAAAIILQLVLVITRFSTQTVFIYVLGKQYTGVAGVFSDVLLMLSMAELGIGAAVLFSLYQPISQKNEEKIYAYIILLKKVYRILALVVLLIGLLLLPFLSYIIKDIPDIKENIKLIFILLIMKASCSYLLSYRTILFEAYQQKRIVSFLSCGVTIFITILQIMVLLLTRQYLLFLFIDIVGVILKNSCIMMISHRKYPMKLHEKQIFLSKEERNQVWKNVGSLSIYRISKIVLNGTDSVIISIMFGTPLVSHLVAYRTIINYIMDFAGQFFYSALPSVGNAVITETSEHNFKLFRHFRFALFVITCITGTCLFTMLTPFVKIWLGEDYSFHISVVAALVLNYYTSMMMIVNTSFRNGYGLYTKGVFSPVIMTLINIVLSLLFGRYFGVFGILIATSISRFSTQLWVDPVLLYKYAFHKKMNGDWKNFIIMLFVMTFCCTLSWGLTSKLSNSIGMLLIRFMVAVVVSSVTLCGVYGKKEEFIYTVAVVKKLSKKLYVYLKSWRG